jgi:hypothetical protein
MPFAGARRCRRLHVNIPMRDRSDSVHQLAIRQALFRRYPLGASLERPLPDTHPPSAWYRIRILREFPSRPSSFVAVMPSHLPIDRSMTTTSG